MTLTAADPAALPRETLRADPSSDAIVRKVAWRIIPFLFVCYLVNFLDRTNIGFAQLALRNDLAFSNAVYGFGASLFYVGYIAFEIPSNLLLERIGAPKTIMRIMVFWGLISVAQIFMSSTTQFYVLRFLLGAGEAGFMPGILYYLSGWAPSSYRARLTSLFMIAIPLSGMLGGPVSGGIMQFLDGVGGLAGWRWLFLLEGAPAVLLGIAAYFVLSPSPQAATWLDSGEKKTLTDEIARQLPVGGNHGHGLLQVLRDPMVYVLAFFCVGMNGSIGGFSFWLPTIVKGFGIASAWHVGLLVSLPYIAGAIVLLLNGRHSDRTRERRWHAGGSLLVASLGWLLLPLAQHSLLASMALLTIATAGTLGCLACFWSMVPHYFPRGAAVAYATVSSLGSLGSLASPALVGWISQITGSVVMGTLYLGGVMVVAATCLLMVTRTRAR